MNPIRQPWKGTMTARERFNRQMHYQSVDRCFNMEFGYWNDNFNEWKLFTENGITNNEEADLFFSFDKIGVCGGNCWINPPLQTRILEEHEKTRLVVNGDGLIWEEQKTGHSSIPRIVGSTIQTPEDWKRFKAEHMVVNDPERTVDVEKLKAMYPDDRDYPLGVYCGSMIGKIRDMLSFEGLCYAIYDYPDMIEDMVQTCCELVCHYLDQVLPVIHFDYASGWEDICFNHGPIINMDTFDNVVVPAYKVIGDRLHKYGIDLWYTDCDGDVRPLLPGFLKSGINCLFPYEVNSCTHPGELLRQYEGQLRIMGGFDKMALGQGKDAIRKYMDSLVPLVEQGGYIPFCDHRCPPNVKEEDYLFYLDLKEEYFGLK